MNTISNILYWISTGLLVPVIVLLIYLFLRSLVMIGTFFGQYMQERRSASKVALFLKGVDSTNIEESDEKLKELPNSVLKGYMQQVMENRGNEPRLEMLLSEYEIDADRNISSSKVLTKMGPILGLMGTLIPMGPALVGLAQGDIASMAYNMQVAFATTVVGLVVSAIGFLTQQVKERWAMSNMTALEYLAEVAMVSKTDEK